MSAMRCVTLNQIDPSYMMCIRSFVVHCPHYSILSSPLPFRCDKISRKGRFFRSSEKYIAIRMLSNFAQHIKFRKKKEFFWDSVTVNTIVHTESEACQKQCYGPGVILKRGWLGGTEGKLRRMRDMLYTATVLTIWAHRKINPGTAPRRTSQLAHAALSN